LTTAEIARFGQLYLQKGVWQGTPLLPKSWVEEATTLQVSTGNAAKGGDWEQGYGYQFWRCRYGAYRGDGAFGQFCLVLPEQEAVIAITAGTNDMQAILNLVWKRLMPAMGTTALPPNPSAQQALALKLENLVLPIVTAQPLTATAALITGKRFVFKENNQKVRALTLEFDQKGNSTLTVESAKGRQRLECGNGEWRKGTTTLDQNNLRKVAACGGWVSADNYEIRLYYLTAALPEPPPRGVSITPFGLTINCIFKKNRLIVEQRADQSFAALKRPRLEGRLSD
jgi:hypothetical protein